MLIIGEVMLMYFRKSYVDRIYKHKDKDYIKVITGIRRSGKSTILMQYQDVLKNDGVDDKHIIQLNLEDIENEKYLDYHVLNDYVLECIQDNERHYLFLDEIQRVTDFEILLNSLNLKKNLDIYITGSNFYMLSSELATYISGRYVEIFVLPFSFKEYYDFVKKDSRIAFKDYLQKGGFPYTLYIEDEKTYKDYLQGIINTIIVQDIMRRKRITDSLLLESIAKFVFSNVGNLVTIKKISDTLTSTGRKSTAHTIDAYLTGIIEALIVYKVNRYDIWGKTFLQQNSKYYLADLSLKNAYVGVRRSNLGHDLENIVYLELLRRGYGISIGNIKGKEIDFVAEKADEKMYIQVSASVLDEKTFNREIEPLLEVEDNYPKILLTLDEIPMGEKGINQLNVIDWLIAD